MPPMSPGNTVANMDFKGKRWNRPRQGIKGVTFTNVSMAGLTLFRVTFTDCTFQDCLFRTTRFKEVEFHNCKFVNCNFWKSRFEQTYLKPENIRFARRYRVEAANVGVTFYHALMANYADQRQDAFFARADIEFRRWKRFQLAHDIRQHKESAWRGNWRRMTSWLYEMLAGYGYKPGRLFVITLLAFIAISIANHFLIGGDLLINGSRPAQISFVDSVYYSFSVLTVLGFSTVVPDSPAAKLLTVAEALASIGWLAIFTSVLVKRFLR